MFGLPSLSLGGKFPFDQLVQVLADFIVIETLNDFIEESGDEEALGDFCGNAAGAQIKKFVFVDLT